MERITTREQLDWKIKSRASTGVQMMVLFGDKVNYEMAQVVADELKKEFRDYIANKEFDIALNKFYVFDKIAHLADVQDAEDYKNILRLSNDVEREMRKEYFNALKEYFANDGIIW